MPERDSTVLSKPLCSKATSASSAVAVARHWTSPTAFRSVRAAIQKVSEVAEPGAEIAMGIVAGKKDKSALLEKHLHCFVNAFSRGCSDKLQCDQGIEIGLVVFLDHECRDGSF